MREATLECCYPTAWRIAAVRAAAVVKRYSLPAEDQSDLVQEALLELWRKRLAYDPQRGSWRTFSERVVNNRLASLIRHKNARCRRRLIEVDVDCLADSLPAPDSCIEAQTDVVCVLAAVSPFDRAVAIALSEYSAVETGIRLGVGRTTVYRAIMRLRNALTAAGLSAASSRDHSRNPNWNLR